MFTTISDNVTNPVGVHLLASFGYAFDAVKVQPLLAPKFLPDMQPIKTLQP